MISWEIKLITGKSELQNNHFVFIKIEQHLINWLQFHDIGISN